MSNIIGNNVDDSDEAAISQLREQVIAAAAEIGPRWREVLDVIVIFTRKQFESQNEGDHAVAESLRLLLLSATCGLNAAQLHQQDALFSIGQDQP